METVYLETTLISYLVSRPSRDLVVAAHQQVTRDWWIRRRPGFDCYISQAVLDEAAAGDPGEAQARLEAIKDTPVLEITVEAESLAAMIMDSGILPPRAMADAAHIAIATINLMDYLLTWNCKHLANAQLIRRISVLCNRAGYSMPVICTPEELMGE